MFRTCDSDFNLERHLIPFLTDCAFFTELSRHLTKLPTRDIPTAAVCFDPRTDQIAMYYNPDFMATLSNSEVRGVLTHEFYHLVFGHVTARRKNPSRMWNVATDLAINSIILENAGRTRLDSDDVVDQRPLPRFADRKSTRLNSSHRT